jgi:hypothetical protein
MSDYDQHPTNTFAAWANAFAPAELGMIEAIGDRLTAEKATVAAATQEGIVRDTIRVTQTAWIALTAETKWIYDRVQGVTRSLNDRVYQFDLRGYSEHLQYSVYHDHESGHYDWHVDQGRSSRCGASSPSRCNSPIRCSMTASTCNSRTAT